MTWSERGLLRTAPLEVLLDLPLDHLVDDHAEGHAVAAAALELGEEPDRDLRRDRDRVVLAPQLEPAAVEDDAVVALDEATDLAGLLESPVLFVARIVHRGDSHAGHVPILRVPASHLANGGRSGHPRSVEEEQGSYREELRFITFLLADIKVAVEEILSYIRGDHEEEEEQDDPDS